MTIQDPGDPDPYIPPKPDDDHDQDNPFERPPFEQDPEAQRAPGAGESETGNPEPPMQAAAGNDNIREGKVGGVMGPPHQSMGQGQGG